MRFPFLYVFLILSFPLHLHGEDTSLLVAEKNVGQGAVSDSHAMVTEDLRSRILILSTLNSTEPPPLDQLDSGLVESSLSAHQEGLIYSHQLFSVEDGLAARAVLCGLQDQRGFLWFGTRNGLNRFDGKKFILTDLPY